ncbi:MAG: ARMT1-like domain-containing protein [Verrucomicrobiia bacterium]
MNSGDKPLAGQRIGMFGRGEHSDTLRQKDYFKKNRFDRDLLAQLPPGNFTVAVRGAPVLNGATLADAEWAGLAGFCEIITNGSDAPGTLLGDCSPEFRARFAAADVVIAKGQVNYESLAGVNQNIFFLLKVKCPVIAERLQCPVGGLVLHHLLPTTLLEEKKRRAQDSGSKKGKF